MEKVKRWMNVSLTIMCCNPNPNHVNNSIFIDLYILHLEYCTRIERDYAINVRNLACQWSFNLSHFVHSWICAMRNSHSPRGKKKRDPFAITVCIRQKFCKYNFFSTAKLSVIKLSCQCTRWCFENEAADESCMHQTHTTPPSAPVLLWCLWEQTVLVFRTWDVCLFSITTWPQFTPSE